MRKPNRSRTIMPQKGIANELCDETMCLIPSKLQRKSLRIKTSIKNLIKIATNRRKLEINKKKYGTINQNAESLDFYAIKETIKLNLFSVEPNSRQEIHIKEQIENAYKADIITQVQLILHLSEKKAEYTKEIVKWQKEISQLKNKIKYITESLYLFKVASEKHSSITLYKKYIMEKDLATKKINECTCRIECVERNISIKVEGIQAISKRIRELKTSKDKKISLLTKYYCELLSGGKDLRNDGLSWILYKLMELGYNVNRCQYPDYISKKNFEYLLKVADKKINLEKIRIVYNAIKTKFKHIKNNSTQVFQKTQTRLPIITEATSTLYEKFLKFYLKDKNSMIHLDIKKEKEKIKLTDFIDESTMDSIVTSPPSPIKRRPLKIYDEISKETIEEVSTIKQEYERCQIELTGMIKSKMSKFKTENEDLKILDPNKYRLLLQSLFGLYVSVA